MSNNRLITLIVVFECPLRTFAQTLCTLRQLRVHQRHNWETQNIIERSGTTPKRILNIACRHAVRSWTDSTNLEHQFECAQAALIAAAFNRVCDTSSGTGTARDMRACLPLIWPTTTGMRLKLPPGSCRRDRLRTPAAVTAADLCRSALLRSARLGTARCRSSLCTATARAPPSDVTAVLYTRRLVQWGKGQVGLRL